MKFQKELDIRFHEEGNRGELLDDFIYLSEVLEDIIVVPKGFETDFASVPRILWNILPPIGKYTKAAVIHDYLYAKGENLTRNKADAVFLEAMRDLDVWEVTRFSMWMGVRLGGWVPWIRYRKRK